MKDFREQLVALIHLTTEMIFFYRKQFYYRATKLLREFIAELMKQTDMLTQLLGEEWLTCLGMEKLLTAQEMQDEILLTDILEAYVLPVLEQAVQQIEEKIDIETIDYFEKNCYSLGKMENVKIVKLLEEFDCEQTVEFTASGDITVRFNCENQMYYICGNNNPYKDALYFAEANIQENMYRYILLGSDLFYEAEAFLKLRSDLELTIVEEDMDVLYCAMRYRDLSKLFTDKRVNIVCSSYMDVIRDMDETQQILVIKKNAMRRMRKIRERERLEMFFLRMMTCKEQGDDMERNFRDNMREEVHSIDEMQKQFERKTICIVAGGPSLDKSVDVLKNREDMVVVCVGTVLERLLKEHIVPDFVIITDAQEAMCRQLECASLSLDTKLLYMCSANAKAVSRFEGDKYIIFQKGFSAAETYALEKGYTLFLTGGSVSTTALDIALRFGATKIVCMGLDLAYTNNQSHAKGTFEQHEIMPSDNYSRLLGVNGEMIPTEKNLMTYHHWIEHRIQDEKNVELINISDGAFISGMKNISTRDAKKQMQS